jgi:uncharacterized RDD family membrane protein YckC
MTEQELTQEQQPESEQPESEQPIEREAPFAQVTAPPYVPPQYAGFWLRTLALVLDTLALYSFYVLLRFVSGQPVSNPSIKWLLFELLIGFIYYISLTAVYGQTLGKMVLGVRVIAGENQRPGPGTVLFRELIGKFVSFITLFIGYMLAGWNKEKRALHDILCGTYVVIINEEEKPHVETSPQ